MALPVVGLTLIVFAIDLVPLYFMAQGMLRLVIVLLLSMLTFCGCLVFRGIVFKRTCLVCTAAAENTLVEKERKERY